MEASRRVVIVSRAPRGGHPRYSAELARAVHEQGAEVALVQPAEAFADTAALLDGFPIERVSIPEISRGWFRQEAAIIGFLKRRGGPGIVLFEETSPMRALSLLLLTRQTTWSLVTMVHNTRAHGHGRADRARHKLAMAALAVPHRVLVHNELQRDELLQMRSTRATSIDVVPHGLWTRHAHGDAGSPTLDGFVNRLLMFGVMRDNSGLSELEVLARRLSSERPEATISVIGKAASDAVSAQLARLSVLPNVEVRAGFVADEEVPEIFDRHDALVLPYTNYSSESGVLIEAVGYRMPVITAGDGSVVRRVRELGIGPAPDGSLLDQTIEALDASRVEREHWDQQLLAARAALSWTRQAEILLDRPAPS